MELFEESVEIKLLAEIKETDNYICHYLGVKRGVISKESDNGYSFVVNDNEKFFFYF